MCSLSSPSPSATSHTTPFPQSARLPLGMSRYGLRKAEQPTTTTGLLARMGLPSVSGVIFLSAYVRWSSDGPSARSAILAGSFRAARPAGEVSS